MGSIYTYTVIKCNLLGYWCLNTSEDLGQDTHCCIRSPLATGAAFTNSIKKKRNKPWMPKFGSLTSRCCLNSVLIYNGDNQRLKHSGLLKICLSSGTGPVHISNKINWEARRKILAMIIHTCKYIWYIIWLSVLSGEQECLNHRRFQNISSTNGVLCLVFCIFGQYLIL